MGASLTKQTRRCMKSAPNPGKLPPLRMPLAVYGKPLGALLPASTFLAPSPAPAPASESGRRRPPPMISLPMPPMAAVTAPGATSMPSPWASRRLSVSRFSPQSARRPPRWRRRRPLRRRSAPATTSRFKWRNASLRRRRGRQNAMPNPKPSAPPEPSKKMEQEQRGAAGQLARPDPA